MKSNASFVFGNSKSRRFSDAATLQVKNEYFVKQEIQTNKKSSLKHVVLRIRRDPQYNLARSGILETQG